MITAIVLAKKTDVPLYTIRYYTRIGLLQPTRNAQNNYKLYQPSDTVRLRFITGAAKQNKTVAMETGTDVAMERADITLLKGDLRGILRARNLSRATMRNIRQNLFFAFVYNLVGVPVAAGVLYPVFGLLLSPMIASAAMTFSSVSVILNALRLRNIKL